MESLNTDVRVSPPRAAADQSECSMRDLTQPFFCSEAFFGAPGEPQYRKRLTARR